MINRTFVLRVMRNLLVDRDHPFFAHFFVTERCNLRCEYCTVYKNPSEELDEEGCKKVIDRIAEMKVAVISFTGGEPLLRKDIFRLIDHAKSKEMLVKISSNGTLSRQIYSELMKTGIDSINISMDGIFEGTTLPYGKIDRKILSTIEFLVERRGKKQIFVSALYYNGNASYIRRMVKTLLGSIPSLEIFVQPIMTGEDGRFRTCGYELVDPQLLFELKKYPNVTNPHYFNEHCEQYYKRGGNYPWSCKAGRMFFDIKPTGDFWICQDRPSPLNILEEDFIENWKRLNIEKLKKGCRGCTYSCYVLTQRSFEFRNALTWYHYSKRL